MKVFQIHPTDNVWVVLQNLEPAEQISLNGLTVYTTDAVKAKHKIACKDFHAGDEIIMYGTVVGRATTFIRQGEVITPFNVRHATSPAIIRPSAYKWTPPDVAPYQHATFNGFIRDDGRAGIANYWIIFPLVFCENRNVELLKKYLPEKLGFYRPDRFSEKIDYLIQSHVNRKQPTTSEFHQIGKSSSRSPAKLFPHVDDIRFLVHEGGCGGMRADSEALCALLAGYIRNSNVAGATVLSLGCQNAQVDIFLEKLHAIYPDCEKPVYIVGHQEHGNTERFLSEAITRTLEGLEQANMCKRSPVPFSKLCIGLECGGSDGFSGITANPLAGLISDMIVALGGAAVLAEFPELHGVEQHIIDRCTDVTVAEKFMQLMARYEKLALQAGTHFDMNPSPGNLRDGIITDAMKSAGAARKGGTSPIVEVLNYTGQVTKPGLHLLCTPGNDVESTTALAASGCNLILFTTGLGTPTGNPVAPVIKIASNSMLAEKMPDIIDFDAGLLFSENIPLTQLSNQLFDLIRKVADGTILPKAVLNEQHDFIPWKRGISL